MCGRMSKSVRAVARDGRFLRRRLVGAGAGHGCRILVYVREKEWVRNLNVGIDS